MPVNLVSNGLDWQEFSAARFPGRSRHDLEALVAYGAYKVSQEGGEGTPGEAGAALESWEDEGGPAQ